MSRPKKDIPLEDIKGLITLIDEGKTQEEIAAYFNCDQATISRKLREMKEGK